MTISAESWVSPQVWVATTFWDRLKGIKGAPTDSGIALRSRAIHTVGVDYPLGAFGIDRAGTVVEVKMLTPNRFFYFRGASVVVELPEGSELPREGATVSITYV